MKKHNKKVLFELGKTSSGKKGVDMSKKKDDKSGDHPKPWVNPKSENKMKQVQGSYLVSDCWEDNSTNENDIWLLGRASMLVWVTSLQALIWPEPTAKSFGTTVVYHVTTIWTMMT